MAADGKYFVFIGFETHLQLKTKTKLFCACPVTFLERPNSATCPVCLGMPGSLPRLNSAAIELAIMAAKLINADINLRSKFDRKNYFYPDLPKNYQITQYDIPFARGGWVEIASAGARKNVIIERMHLEEDAGKLIHSETENESFVDLNRSGVPLIEIVTKPCINSADEAVEYLKKLRQLMRYCEVSSCDMEKGEMRCDVNVSVSADGKLPPHKTEIKNMNSFRFIKRALVFEIDRQVKLLESGAKLMKKTYGFNPEKGTTFEMRSKEEAMDYRYFPEPDLPPLVVDERLVEQVAARIPELPEDKARRFVREFGISEYQARILTDDRTIADVFERCAKKFMPVQIANWLVNDAARILDEHKLDAGAVAATGDELAELARLFYERRITNTVAKDFLEQMLVKGSKLSELLKTGGGADLDVRKLAAEVIAENRKAVADFKGGKETAIKFLIGQVMKKTKGRTEAKEAEKILRELLTDA